MKILFWFGLALLVWLALRKTVRGNTGAASRESASGASTMKEQTKQPSESMVSCASCGLYVPESESISRAGKQYCCSAHAQQ